MNENYFDQIADEYAEEILDIQPQFYENCATIINSVLKKNDCVLDVGNGGLIAYHTKKLARLDCADLTVSHKAIEKYKSYKNIFFFQSNIMNMENIANDTYDVVIVEAVLHHLAGSSFKNTYNNVVIALKECLRVLKPNGKLLILESTVKYWFEIIERFFLSTDATFFSPLQV